MDVILGMGTRAPSVPFERAEFVRADQTYSIMNRIVKATQVDTILHTFMITNSTSVPRRAMHEINVIGTMNLLAAAGAAGSSVRHIVVKSSTLVYGSAASDPNTFDEDTPRTSPVRNSVERALVEAEGLVRDFAEDNPGTRVTVLRFANVLGDAPHHADQPQPVATRSAPPSSASTRSCSSSRRTTSCAPCSTSPRGASPASTTWPATAGSPGARWRPSAGPGSSRSRPYSPLKIRPLARLFDLPAELEDLLRYGRGVDTRRFAATGFTYDATSAGAVQLVHPGVAAAPAIGQAAARRTPTSTTWSSSSATRPPSSAATTSDRQLASHSSTSSRSRTAHSSAVMA